MKKIILMVVSAMISTLTFSQKLQVKNVPSSVKATFQKQYPNAKEVKWEQEERKFEASFNINKIANSVLFDSNGNILETEVEIGVDHLPKNILEYVNAKYKGKKIKEAAMITDDKGAVIYETEINGFDLLFDAAGEFIKAEKD